MRFSQFVPFYTIPYYIASTVIGSMVQYSVSYVAPLWEEDNVTWPLCERVVSSKQTLLKTYSLDDFTNANCPLVYKQWN